MRRGDQEVFPRRLDTNVAGAEGELTVSVNGRRAFVHDGKTPGGVPLVDAIGSGLKRVSGVSILNKRPKRIIGVGDSIMQSSSSRTSSGFDAAGNVIPDNWNAGNGVFEQSLWKANGLGTRSQYEFVANMGIGGETTTQILARFDRDVIAYAPDCCFIIAGTNDITNEITDAQVQLTMGNLEQMILKCVNAGIQVFLATPPCRDEAAIPTQNIQPYYYDLASYYSVPLLDINRIVVDPATGTYKDGLSGDGVHPNAVASDSISTELAKAFANPDQYINAPYLGATAFLTVNNASNLVVNGNFSQGVDGDDNPLGWTSDQGDDGAGGTANTISVSTPATLPFTGNKAIYTVAADGKSGAYALYGNNLNAVFQDGDTMEFAAGLKIAGLDPATSAGVTFQVAFDGPFANASAPVHTQVADFDGIVQAECHLPQGATTINVQLYTQDLDVVYTVQNVTLTNKSARARVWAPGAADR